ncbi:MAG: ATP-binding protein [Alphaproteobacteria bacterium]|nr:ATP-binding protein [Alphaproteobacteria bacterium]
MRLKSFQAKSMPDAMQQIKDALGEDAIIVSSREESGGWIRVTAAIEALPQPDLPKPATQGPPPPQDFAEEITEALLQHRLPAKVSDKIISAAADIEAASAEDALASALRSVYSFGDLMPEDGKAIVLVGPPGAGKTLMTAKLAAESVLNGQRPAVITTDIARAGGVEQLEAFLDILALPLQPAQDAQALKTALAKSASAPLTIIDTGGLNPFDPAEMKELAKLLATGPMEPALVLPAGLDAEEAAEIAQTFQVLGVRNIVPTRLDFARRLGGILSAADTGSLRFTEASHTPQVANGIIRLSPDRLAALLLPHNNTGATP